MFFLPKTIYEVDSAISGRIRVVEQGSKRRVIVGGYTQSQWDFQKGGAGLTGTYWMGLLQSPFPLAEHPKTLVLGVGGGTIIKLLQEKFGEILITAVEIDPTMITVAREYFQVDGVDWVCQDAISYVQKLRQERVRFDFIVTDVAIGNVFSPNIATEEFVANCRSILTTGGIIVYNLIVTRAQQEQVQPLLKMVKQVFGRFGSVIIPGVAGADNLLLFGQAS